MIKHLLYQSLITGYLNETIPHVIFEEKCSSYLRCKIIKSGIDTGK